MKRKIKDLKAGQRFWIVTLRENSSRKLETNISECLVLNNKGFEDGARLIDYMNVGGSLNKFHGRIHTGYELDPLKHYTRSRRRARTIAQRLGSGCLTQQERAFLDIYQGVLRGLERVAKMNLFTGKKMED